MLEDDQRFEELESKLAALSSQVESLELDTELDPFSEDDVRRTVEYFKSLELAGLESEDFGEEDFDDDDESSSDDFISVQTTGGPSFKTHWIAPTSCENMTRDLARDAFVQGAADRYGTSQQVNNGDVLILLCREPVEEEEPEEGSEPAEPTAPKEICRYIGLAYNTLTNPTSAEPPLETEESISAAVGNYEIFVWSSCECSSADSNSVELTILKESGSSLSSAGDYASFSNDSVSPDTSYAESLITDASLRIVPGNDSAGLADALTNRELTSNLAGYKAKLTQLSQDLTDYYLDKKSSELNFSADKKKLNSHTFSADSYTSTKVSLSNTACGNLSAVSMSGGAVELSLLKAGGSVDSSQNFLTSAHLSLGSTVSIAGQDSIKVWDTNSEAIEDSDIFLPRITSETAEKINVLETSTHNTLSLANPIVSGGGGKFRVSISTNLISEELNFSSGLLTEKKDTASKAGSIAFELPDREVSIADLLDIDSKTSIHPYPISSLSNLRAGTPEYLQDSSAYRIPVSADLKKVQSTFGGGLYEDSTEHEHNAISLGYIEVPAGIDGSVSIASNIGFTASKTPASDGINVSLGVSWDHHESTFSKGHFDADSDDVKNAINRSFNIVLEDLADPGTSGTVNIIESLKDFSATGEYDNEGALKLHLEFVELRKQLGFKEDGFFSTQVSLHDQARVFEISIPQPSLGLTGNESIEYYKDFSVDQNDRTFTIKGVPYTTTNNYDKGHFQSGVEESGAAISLASFTVPEASIYTPVGYTGDLETTGYKQIAISESSAQDGTSYAFTGNIFNHTDDYDSGALQERTVSNSSVNIGSIFVPDAIQPTSSLGVIRNTAVRVVGNYDKVYYDEITGQQIGDAKYYVKYTWEECQTEFVDGTLQIAEESCVAKDNYAVDGPIIVKGTEIRYGCDPDYGCILDPAGEYTDPYCGSGCPEYEDPCFSLLTYRPSYIYLYFYNATDECYVFKGEYSINTEHESNAVDAQYYSQEFWEDGTHYMTELNQARFTAVCEPNSSQINTVFEFSDPEIGDQFIKAHEPDYKITTSPLSEYELCDAEPYNTHDIQSLHDAESNCYYLSSVPSTITDTITNALGSTEYVYHLDRELTVYCNGKASSAFYFLEGSESPNTLNATDSGVQWYGECYTGASRDCTSSST